MEDSGNLVGVEDRGRVRRLTLNRPGALNAFDEALYDALTDSLIQADRDSGVAVVLLTGSGRSFSAGTDVKELASRATGGEFEAGRHGFAGLLQELTYFPKPLICAVNGLALGIGVTILGYADLALMSSEAKVRCPFTDLAVVPEAGSSYLFPLLMGRQAATWMLMSSEWFTASQCLEMGLAWRVCEPDRLLDEAQGVADLLAKKPIASLIETKRAIVAGHRDAIERARRSEEEAFGRLLGQPASLEAFAALAERRPPQFERVDADAPVDQQLHAGPRLGPRTGL